MLKTSKQYNKDGQFIPCRNGFQGDF